MSAITITLTGVCSGGDHISMAITGDKTGNLVLNGSDVTDPITEGDVAMFCKVIAKLAKTGRTVAQAKALLEAGVTVTV